MASLRGIARTGRIAAAPFGIIRQATATPPSIIRCASSQAAAAAVPPTDPVFQDMETESSMVTPPLPANVKVPSPRERSQQRKVRLPGSKYQYHPPKFDRGPLHPLQSPAPSEPIARDFVPGPFHQPRLRQTYHSTIASDLMTLGYTHVPPGTEKAPVKERLRSWDDSSPYHKNRPLRPPKGNGALWMVEKPITFNNIPDIRSITIAAYVPMALRDPDWLVVAQAVLQALTGTIPEVTTVKTNVAQWHITKGLKGGAKVTIYGNTAYDFLDRCIHLVFPKIKEWPGVKGTTGDSSGNLAWGLRPEDIVLFPEVEANTSMYPSNQMPGCRIYVETTAKSDRHARLLLKAMGVPFYGDLRD